MYKCLIAFLLLLTISFAEDYVVVNSQDGRDVLSAIFYANVKNIPIHFMPVNSNAEILAAKVGAGHDILLVESEDLPMSAFVENKLKEKNNITILKSTDGGITNLLLAKQSGAEKFIIVDSAYAENALSALPYAALLDAYIILANKDNAEQIKTIVSSAKKIIIFGYVDKEVKEALAELNPEYLGNGEDRFEDNVAIVKRIMAEFGSKQVLLTDGTFIEEGMSNGNTPILYIAQITPSVTYEFLKESIRENKLSGAILVGSELTLSTYDMRTRIINDLTNEGYNRTFGIIIKFGQAIPSVTGMTNLDVFPVPIYTPELSIESIKYNSVTKKIELLIKNKGDGIAYYKSEIKIKLNGEIYKILRDSEIKLLERAELKGNEYEFDFDGMIGNVSANIITKYGTTKKSLEKFETYSSVLESIAFSDTSNIEIIRASYDKKEKELLISIKNPGAITTYVTSEVEVLLNGINTKIKSEGVRTIENGSISVEKLPIELTARDIDANKNITITVKYGGREGYLNKQMQIILPLKSEQELDIIFILLGLVVLIVLIVGFLLLRKK